MHVGKKRGGFAIEGPFKYDFIRSKPECVPIKLDRDLVIGSKLQWVSNAFK